MNLHSQVSPQLCKVFCVAVIVPAGVGQWLKVVRHKLIVVTDLRSRVLVGQIRLVQLVIVAAGERLSTGHRKALARGMPRSALQVLLPQHARLLRALELREELVPTYVRAGRLMLPKLAHQQAHVLQRPVGEDSTGCAADLRREDTFVHIAVELGDIRERGTHYGVGMAKLVSAPVQYLCKYALPTPPWHALTARAGQAT